MRTLFFETMRYQRSSTFLIQWVFTRKTVELLGVKVCAILDFLNTASLSGLLSFKCRCNLAVISIIHGAAILETIMLKSLIALLLCCIISLERVQAGAIDIKPSAAAALIVVPSDGAINVMTNQVISVSLAGANSTSPLSIESLSLIKDGHNADGELVKAQSAVQFFPQRLQYNKTYTVVVTVKLRQAGIDNLVTKKYSSRFATINPKADSVVFFRDFDDESPKLYTEHDLHDRWHLKGKPVGLKQGRVAVVVGDKENPSNMLRIRYPALTRGLGDGGVQWRTRLPKHDELYVSFWVKFGAGFDFVKGGKIPGLAGGAANTGGGTNRNAKPQGDDGWSARMMWRPQGAAVQYIYHPDQPHSMGQDFKWDINQQRYFIPGKWHKLETRIKMNSPGKSNGIVQSWFDGTLALDRDNLRFRDVDTFAIDQFLFSTLFGGSDDTWATTKEEFVYFDNFIVSTLPITH